MKHILKFYLNLNYKRKMVLTCVLVGLIPLTLLGTFCYSQTVSMLLEKEQDSMSSSVNTAYNSMNHEIQLYEDQISYLTNLETIIHVASDSYDSTIEKFEVLNYTYDVLLSGIYSQHPEISQITLYVDRTDLFHGKQLRRLRTWRTSPGMILWRKLLSPSGIWIRTATSVSFREFPIPTLNSSPPSPATVSASGFSPRYFFRF